MIGTRPFDGIAPSEQLGRAFPALAELEVDGVAYRVDPGRVSSVAASWRESGSWDWTAVTPGQTGFLQGHAAGHRLSDRKQARLLLTMMLVAVAKESMFPARPFNILVEARLRLPWSRA